LNDRGNPSDLVGWIAIELIIAILDEGLLPAIAALGYVIRIAGQHQTARLLCHLQKIPK
jgi:hypothetical protein